MPQIQVRRNYISEEGFEEEESPIQFIMTYFDPIQGPMMFLATPSEVSPLIQEACINLLDLQLPEGFFEHTLVETKSILGNYIFHIPSQWARGKRESVMLTIVLDVQYRFNRLKKFISKIAELFKETPNLYKAFYMGSRREDEEIKPQFYFINDTLFSASQFLSRFIESVNMGKILVVGNHSSGKDTYISTLTNMRSNPLKKFLTHEQLKSENIEKLHIAHTPPDDLILDFFLDQVEFWLYDTDENCLPLNMWFPICKDPLGMVLIDDLTQPEEQRLGGYKRVIEILEYYSQNHSYRSKPLYKFPILILGNQRDEEITLDRAEMIASLRLMDFPIVFKILSYSVHDISPILDSVKWIVSKVFRIGKN